MEYTDGAWLLGMHGTGPLDHYAEAGAIRLALPNQTLVRRNLGHGVNRLDSIRFLHHCYTKLRPENEAPPYHISAYFLTLHAHHGLP